MAKVKKAPLKSRFRGVFRCGTGWKAQYQRHNKLFYLGVFASEEEAALAYDRCLLQNGCNPSRCNFTSDCAERRPQPLEDYSEEDVELQRVFLELHRTKTTLQCNRRTIDTLIQTGGFSRTAHNEGNRSSGEKGTAGHFSDDTAAGHFQPLPEGLDQAVVAQVRQLEEESRKLEEKAFLLNVAQDRLLSNSRGSI